MPNKPWQVPESVTPFAQMLLDWMWSKRPPMNVSQLSYLTGIHKQTIWNWIREDRIPNPRTLQQLAQGTGIPLETLYEVCGYAVPESVPDPDPILSPEEAARWEAQVRRIMNDRSLRPEQRRALVLRTFAKRTGQDTAPYEHLVRSEHVVESTIHPAVHPTDKERAQESTPQPQPQRATRTGPRRRESARTQK